MLPEQSMRVEVQIQPFENKKAQVTDWKGREADVGYERRYQKSLTTRYTIIAVRPYPIEDIPKTHY